MELIILLVALAALHFAIIPDALQRDAWYFDWRNSLTYLPDGWFRLLVALVLPVLGLDLLLRFVEGWAWGLFSFAIATVILLYSFGRGELNEEIRLLSEDADREDTQGIFRRVDALRSRANDIEARTEDGGGLASQVIGVLSYRFLEHIFAVAFWFFVLGPAAALLYRLLYLEVCGQGLSESEEENRDADLESGNEPGGYSDLAQNLLFWSEWLPVRVLGLILAIVGNFSACIETWLESLVSTETSASLLRTFVASSFDSQPSQESPGGVGATGNELALNIRSLKPLFVRCLLAWLVFAAVLTVSF